MQGECTVSAFIKQASEGGEPCACSTHYRNMFLRTCDVAVEVLCSQRQNTKTNRALQWDTCLSFEYGVDSVADIKLRFHKDMLVLSAPLDYVLARQGVSMPNDYEFISLLEPEMAQDALRLEALAGAQCLVTATEGICPARLAHMRMEQSASDIAAAAIASAQAHSPQHIICEIGPCELPLDPSSKVSLKQSQDQYEAAARACGTEAFDAILLNGMRGVADMRCAIQGVRKVYDGPLFASFDRDELDNLPLEEALAAMLGEPGADADAQADVIGFRSAAAPDVLCDTVRAMASLTDVPILAQISVKAPTDAEKKRASLGGPIEGNPYPLPDALADAALALRKAGAQFLRACGEATPAYTGALCMATMGCDCIR